MIDEPNCSKRNCRYFLGVKWLGDTEVSEVVHCQAFPLGIPQEISYGNNKHLKIFKTQKNDITFEVQ